MCVSGGEYQVAVNFVMGLTQLRVLFLWEDFEKSKTLRFHRVVKGKAMTLCIGMTCFLRREKSYFQKTVIDMKRDCC